MQEHEHSVPKIHSLADLLALCIKIDPTFYLIQADLNVLEGYAVLFRYPGQTAEKLEAKQALKAAEAIRIFIRNRLD